MTARVQADWSSVSKRSMMQVIYVGPWRKPNVHVLQAHGLQMVGHTRS